MEPYCGRYAPSPTGPLHFGSLVAALARLEQQGLVYPCACTRREIADSNLSFAPIPGAHNPPLARASGRGGGGEGGALIYPGTCRTGLAAGKISRAMRVRVDDSVIEFEDALQGKLSQNLAAAAGDFVLLRADGLYAYQLAVVVDDAEQGITGVVRGADLLASTPRHIFLQRRLGLRTPRYLHLPAAVNAAGEKLSKQTLAPPVDARDPVPALVQVMDFSGRPRRRSCGARPWPNSGAGRTRIGRRSAFRAGAACLRPSRNFRDGGVAAGSE